MPETTVLEQAFCEPGGDWGRTARRAAGRAVEKQAVSDEHERTRLDGLRARARIIARHVLTHPHLYADAPGDDLSAVSATGRGAAAKKPARNDGAA